jgi:hypothetical protein
MTLQKMAQVFQKEGSLSFPYQESRIYHGA